MKSTEDTNKQDKEHSDKSKNTTAQCVFSPCEQSEIRYFTFDTFEDQLGPLQTPGDGHLLHTEQKAERCGWYIENTCSQTKYNTTRSVTMFVERQSDIPVSQVEGASVERAPSGSRSLPLQRRTFAETTYNKRACFIHTKQVSQSSL